MKRLFSIIFIIVLAVSSLFIYNNSNHSSIESQPLAEQTYPAHGKPGEIANYEYYEKIVDILLWNYIEKEVEKHHGGGLGWWTETVSIIKVDEVDKNGLHGLRYVLKYKVYPYVGPHNSI